MRTIRTSLRNTLSYIESLHPGECSIASYHLLKQSLSMVKRLSTVSLLLILSLFSTSTSFAQKAKRASSPKSSVARKHTSAPESTIRRFYTEYIRSFDRMYEPEQMDSLILAHVTPEASTCHDGS